MYIQYILLPQGYAYKHFILFLQGFWGGRQYHCYLEPLTNGTKNKSVPNNRYSSALAVIPAPTPNNTTSATRRYMAVPKRRNRE
jgi:hypothetical protein